MEINIIDPSDLPKLLGQVHDKWFSLEELEQKDLKDSVSIPVAANQDELSKAKLPSEWLTIHNVLRVEVTDTEKIGFYDINTIDFDRERKCLRIRCGIPAEARLFVADFNITYSSSRPGKG
jgi:hypothetical protein